MEYKIIETTEQKLVITKVEYTFEDGSTSVIDVTHFQPKDENDIIKGVENRFQTEINNKNSNIVIE